MAYISLKRIATWVLLLFSVCVLFAQEAHAYQVPSTPTSEGICIDTDDNDAIYTTQIFSSAGITNLYKNGQYVATFTNLEHANDLAYYKNHIYVAPYSSNKIYRLKRAGDSYTYDKVYTLDDTSNVWNIATYVKNSDGKQLFVIGTGGNNQAQLTFKIAYFRDTDNKFITVGNFTVENPNSNISSNTEANILQGIVYKPDSGYLQICLANKNQQGNKIVAIKLTMTSGTKNYTVSEETIRTFNDFNATVTPKFEIEGMAVDSNYRYYVLTNEAGSVDPVYRVQIQNNTWIIAETMFHADNSDSQLAPSTPTSEGICIDYDDQDAVYTTQYNGDTGIVNLFKNGVYAGSFGKLDQANDIAYYKNHIYVASGNSNEIHRLKRYTNFVGESIYEYEKTYTMADNSVAWNITTYKKNSDGKQLFVIGNGGNNQDQFTFKIAYFRDTDNKFVTVGSFTVENPNSDISSTSLPNNIQGIAYKADTSYLQICLSNKNQQGNKIVAVKLTMTSGTKAYSVEEETIRSFCDFDPAEKTKFELQSMAVDSNYHYYVLVNEVGGSDPVYRVTINNDHWLIHSTIFHSAT